MISDIIDQRYINEDFVLKYISLWAYGYMNGHGHSEGMYRSISDICKESFITRKPKRILDIGCGIGRTTFDLANAFKDSKIIGIDESAVMINYAQRINSHEFEGKKISIPDSGFKNLNLPNFRLSNIEFICTAFENYENRDKQKFDLITNVNFLDRCSNILDNIKKMYDVLAPEGIVVGCTPLNFKKKEHWQVVFQKKDLNNLFIKAGFTPQVFFDNLIYREVLDVRGNIEEYNVICFKFKK